jgi:hypothetical protein
MNKPILSQSRISQIRTAYLWGTFPNIMQAARYCLQKFTISGDSQVERQAICATIWEYHQRLKHAEIPF